MNRSFIRVVTLVAGVAASAAMGDPVVDRVGATAARLGLETARLDEVVAYPDRATQISARLSARGIDTSALAPEPPFRPYFSFPLLAALERLVHESRPEDSCEDRVRQGAAVAREYVAAREAIAHYRCRIRHGAYVGREEIARDGVKEFLEGDMARAERLESDLATVRASIAGRKECDKEAVALDAFADEAIRLDYESTCEEESGRVLFYDVAVK